jgi:hypothetical protein
MLRSLRVTSVDTSNGVWGLWAMYLDATDALSELSATKVGLELRKVFEYHEAVC